MPTLAQLIEQFHAIKGRYPPGIPLDQIPTPDGLRALSLQHQIERKAKTNQTRMDALLRAAPTDTGQIRLLEPRSPYHVHRL